MFGYVTVAAGALSPERQARYRACYCGLCHELHRRYGLRGRMTLSFDMTFLYLLLTSLYEPEEHETTARCLPHPFKPHTYMTNDLCGYCCDMNVVLAYYKGLDDWQDDRSLPGRAQAALLKRAYREVSAAYPQTCATIERCLKKIAAREARGEPSPDGAANLTAEMLGAIYRYGDGLWAPTLARVGEGLGRFVYLMDAYEDLPGDLRRNRYNPLGAYGERKDYETFVKDSLTLLIAESTDAFETLPLVKDMDILRNILYAGCWARYEQIRARRDRKRGVPTPKSGKKPAHKEDGA